MPFPPASLSENLRTRLTEFAEPEHFADWYQGYRWGADTWAHGFPRILELELALTATARQNEVRVCDVKRVVEWGHAGRVTKALQDPLILPLYDEDGKPSRKLIEGPTGPVRRVQSRVIGVGHTGSSKVVRFAMPSEFGAIDSRLVRVFGQDYPGSLGWIDLVAQQGSDGRWSIKPHGWPGGYATWINILRFFGGWLQDQGIKCPHPPSFVDEGLREEGIWYYADVEMALWSYASDQLGEG